MLHELCELRDFLFSPADVFQDFRELSLREYELAPENFHSLPGLSLLAALKLTGVELELISDPNLYLWFESMIRGKTLSQNRKQKNVL